MFEIKLLNTNTLIVNQEAYISLSEHGSVGIKSKVMSTDESIIKVINTRFNYFKLLVPGEIGGDGGQRTYVFKAQKEGTTTIKIQKVFRGKLKEEHSIKIIVSKNEFNIFKSLPD